MYVIEPGIKINIIMYKIGNGVVDTAHEACTNNSLSSFFCRIG